MFGGGEAMDDEIDETCTLHGCDLLDGTAPVLYGFFGTGQKYGPVERSSFRYAWSWSAGGCSVAAGRPSVHAVRYCPVCRAVEAEWLREQLALGADESSWEWFLAGVLGLRGDSGCAEPVAAPDPAT
jgi:hypothetical protein